MFSPTATWKRWSATTNEWILERTGIRERHIVDPGVAASDLAVAAARDLAARHNVDLSTVEAIIVGTVTPDMMYPSTACLVQKKLEIPQAWGFDISAGCSGFVFSLTTGRETGGERRAQESAGDRGGCEFVDDRLHRPRDLHSVWRRRGRGAAGADRRRRRRSGFIDFVHQIEGYGGEYLYMPGGGSLHPSSHETVDQKMHYVHQDGQQVFKYAVKKMAEMTERVLAKNGLTGADMDCFISHQANKRIITATADRLKMPREKVIINIEDYGNTTAGTIPLAMKTAMETGRLKKGDTLLIASVGAGFTSGASVMKWAF